MPEFVKDLEQLRQRARQKLEEGPVTRAYKVDVEKTIKILNEALATEIVCVLRYMHHYFMATGVHGKSIADEFKEHADAERNHADGIAERIQQLGGKPDFNPASLLSRSASQYIEGETLADMIKEDLVAERVVIELYTEMIRYFGDNDPTTRILLEGLLKDEEEHAADLTDLLYIVEPSTGKAEGVDPGTHPLDLHRERRQEERRPPVRAGQSVTETGERPRPKPVEAFSGRGGAAAEITRTRGNETTPEHVPGTTGRPTRERPRQVNQEDEEEGPNGGQHGATRAVRLTRPNRKKRAA